MAKDGDRRVRSSTGQSPGWGRAAEGELDALQQAREFHASTGLTGIIVTKLDGSGKGGCVIAIQNELGIPTRFIGTGEKIDDFDFFESRAFVEKML